MTMRFESATVSKGCSTRLRFTAPCLTTKSWRHVSIASASRASSSLSRKSCLNWPMFQMAACWCSCPLVCPHTIAGSTKVNSGRAESARWIGDTFLLPRIPLQYDAWGIRSAWNAPVLLRMAGDVELPAGTHRFMMRGRALGRLWINGKVVARTKPITKRPPDGEERVTPVAEPPLAGVRVHGYHQQEVFGEATIEPGVTGKSRVVLELVVGGKGHRTETGEVCVAMLSADGKSYELLGAGSTRLPLTDAAVEPALSSIEESLAQLDDQRRRRAAASQNDFWQKRHDLARAWAKENPMPQPRKGPHPNRRLHHVEDRTCDRCVIGRRRAPGRTLPRQGPANPARELFSLSRRKGQRWLEAGLAGSGAQGR